MSPEYYELEKLALATPSIWSRIGKSISNKMPTAAGAKRFLIGRPERLAHEVRTGKALAPGGIIREGFREGTTSPLNFAMMYGLPAAQAYQVAKDPDEKNKGARIGGLLGGSALGMGMWRSTGLLGSIAAGQIGDTLGSSAGSLISKLKSQGIE